MLDISGKTYEMFSGLYVPSPEISIPTQKALGQLTILDTIAVDPENPYEIDDSFAISNRSGRPIEVWVVLARGGLIPYTSETYQQAFERLWSVYTSEEPGSTTEQHRPMIDDDDLVVDGLSLGVGGKKKLKPGLALSFKLTKSKGKPGKTYDRRIQPVAVRTTQKTYEEFGTEILAGDHSDTLLAVNAIRRYDGRRPLQIAPHEMHADRLRDLDPAGSFARKVVQELMVQANKEFGRVPDRANSFPRRVTREVSVDQHGRIVETGTESSSRILRAYYSPHRESHALLETRSYTHTTSPLRRFLDLLGHQIWEARVLNGFKLKNLQIGPMKEILDHVNQQIDHQAVRIGRDF